MKFKDTVEVKEIPRKLSELLPKRESQPKKHYDSTLLSQRISWQDTAGYLSAKSAGLIQEEQVDHAGLHPHQFDRDHSKKYGEHVASQLSGKGMKHDSAHASDQILNILKGGGYSKPVQKLMHAYVHGKVPPEQKRFQHEPVDNFHSDPQYYAGGSFLGTLHFLDGERIERNHQCPHAYEIV